MNIEKLTKEIGSMDSEFIDEALEYSAERQRGGITMSKKKIAVLVAIIAAIMCMVIPLSAESIIRFAWSGKQEDPIIEEGVYYDSFWEHEHYFGSVKDGTSIPVPEDAVKITAVNVDENTVKFVLDIDTSVAPFDVYSQVVIAGGEVHIENSADSRTAGSIGGYWNPMATNLLRDSEGPGYLFDVNKDKLSNKDYQIDGEKTAYSDEMCPPKTYWAYFYILGAYDEEGNGVEIRQEGNLPWVVEFTL